VVEEHRWQVRRFARQFYNAARCTPTRTALLTGVYPHQAVYRGSLDGRCVTIAARGLRYADDGEVARRLGAPHWPRQAKPKDIAKNRGRCDAGWDAISQAG
jgi:hypothetical protein